MSTDDIFTQTNTPVPDTEAAPYKTASEYRPLPSAEHYSNEPKKKTFSNDSDGLKEAAQSLTDDREAGRVPKVAEDAPIVARDFHWDAGRGDRVPDHFTLEPRQAAESLSKVRQQEALSREPDTAAAVDEVRNAWNQSEQPQQPQQVQPQPAEAQTAEQSVQQPQPQQPQDGIDPELAEALSRPKVRAALEETVAQVEQARAAFAQGAKEAAQISAAAVLSQWPQLASLSAQELPHALAAIAKVDPAQAAQIQGQLQRTQNLYNAHLQAEQAQQQVRAQQMQSWVAQQDAEFNRTVSSKESPAVMHKIAENVVALAEEYGVSKQDLQQVWQSQPILRSAAFQRMMVDAARYRIASSEVGAKIHNPVPPVSQRPGVATDQNPDTGVERALAKFRSDPSAKNGADLLRARRDSNSRR